MSAVDEELGESLGSFGVCETFIETCGLYVAGGL